MSTDTNDAI